LRFRIVDTKFTDPCSHGLACLDDTERPFEVDSNFVHMRIGIQKGPPVLPHVQMLP